MTDETGAEVEEIEKPVIKDNSGNLLTFERPLVSETSEGFIEADEEIENDEEKPEIVSNEYRGLTDDKGNAFDPLIHKSPPEQTPTGRWKRIPKSKQKAQVDSVESNAAFRKQAQNFAMLYGNAHVTLFHEHGKIDKQALAPLVDSLESYFVEEGLSELSPKAAVLLSMFNYSTVIVSREPNMQKVKRWFSPLINKVKSLFGKKVKQEVKQPEQKETSEKPEQDYSKGF